MKSKIKEMKKTAIIMSLLLMATFSWMSCSNDDDKLPENGSTNYPELAGTWSFLSSKGINDGMTWNVQIDVNGEQYEELELVPNGTYTLSEWHEVDDHGTVDLNRWEIEERGTWTVSKGYIYLKHGGDVDSYKIDMPNSKTLVLTDYDDEGDWEEDTFVKGSRRP